MKRLFDLVCFEHVDLRTGIFKRTMPLVKSAERFSRLEGSRWLCGYRFRMGFLTKAWESTKGSSVLYARCPNGAVRAGVACVEAEKCNVPTEKS